MWQLGIPSSISIGGELTQYLQANIGLRILHSSLVKIPALANFGLSALIGDQGRLCNLHFNIGRLYSPLFECTLSQERKEV